MSWTGAVVIVAPFTGLGCEVDTVVTVAGATITNKEVL
jgi:hypothetical protein